MNKKITLLLICTFFAFNAVFSQTTNSLSVAADGSYTVTLTETIPADHTARFYALQDTYQDTSTTGAAVTFTLTTPGEMGVNITGGTGAEFYITVGYKLFSNVDNNEHSAHTVEIRFGDVTPPTITLNTPGTQTIEVGAGYSELNATASDIIGGHTDVLTSDIVIDASGVVPGTVGVYSVTYNVDDLSSNSATQVTRTVEVVDTTLPVITLLTPGTQTIEVHSAYSELGATALDNYDGDITADIVVDASAVNTSVVGTYSVTYNVDDANTNSAAEKTRTVEVVDTTIPVITLTGDNPQRIEYNELYTELGATATDNYDDNAALTATISIDASLAVAGSFNGVDFGTLGSYDVHYDVTDANFNVATTVTRTVIVEDTTKPELTITGDNPQLIEIIDGADAVYVELGATASDEFDVDVDDADIVIDTSALTPNLGTVGCYPVTYTVTDASGNTRVRTRIVFVLEEGMPWAKDDVFNVAEDSSNNLLSIIANDSYGTDGANTQGDPISLYGTYSRHGGKIDVVGNQVQYTPRAGFTGVDDFKYLITDDTDDSRTATVTINVAEEASPTAVDYEIEVVKNSGVTSVNVLENSTYGLDGAAASDALTVGSANSAEGGTTVVNGTTLVDYTPANDFTGLDSFFYTIKDADGDESTGVVLIRVIEGGTGTTSGPMIARADAFTVSQNSGVNTLNVFADNGSGADEFGSAGIIADGLTMLNGTYSGTSNKGGTIVINRNLTTDTSDDIIEYTPAAGFTGNDGFYYRITDANGASAIGLVTITVQEVASPTAASDSVTVIQDSGVTTIDVLANDSFGSDGAAASGSLTLPLGTSTLGGTVVVNGSAIDYTPPAGITGADDFQYTIEDVSGDQSTAIVTINIVAPGLSDTPTAQDDVVSVNQDTSNNVISILDDNGNGADEYGTDGARAIDPISLYGTHSRYGGVIVVNGNTVEYTPRAGYVGSDEFKYLITDATNESSTATVTITVNAYTPPKEGNSIAFKTDFMVYPNPSEGDVKLSVYSAQQEEVSVVLFDVTGKVIYNNKQRLSIGNNTLDLSVNVKAGIMFLKVYSENTNFGTKKVVFK